MLLCEVTVRDRDHTWHSSVPGRDRDALGFVELVPERMACVPCSPHPEIALLGDLADHIGGKVDSTSDHTTRGT